MSSVLYSSFGWRPCVVYLGHYVGFLRHGAIQGPPPSLRRTQIIINTSMSFASYVMEALKLVIKSHKKPCDSLYSMISFIYFITLACYILLKVKLSLFLGHLNKGQL